MYRIVDENGQTTLYQVIGSQAYENDNDLALAHIRFQLQYAAEKQIKQTKRLACLSLEKEQHSRSHCQDRQDVAAVGEAEIEKRRVKRPDRISQMANNSIPRFLGIFMIPLLVFDPASRPPKIA